MSIRRMVLALSLVSCLALGGCGGASDDGPRPLTEAQKAEQAARDKATADAFKASHQKNPTKGQAGKSRKQQVVNGVRTS